MEFFSSTENENVYMKFISSIENVKNEKGEIISTTITFQNKKHPEEGIYFCLRGLRDEFIEKTKYGQDDISITTVISSYNPFKKNHGNYDEVRFTFRNH
jgi:hypothetical protein